MAASNSIRLRRTLRAISSLHRSFSSSAATSAPPISLAIRRALPSAPPAPWLSRSFRSSSDDDDIVCEGCDYHHWIFGMDFPGDNKPSPEEMVRTYEETCAKGLGISVEEAKQKIYACGTSTYYTGFQAVMSEEESKKFEKLPGVIAVLPDCYIDPVIKDYGGDKYINGTIIRLSLGLHRYNMEETQEDVLSKIIKSQTIREIPPTIIGGLCKGMEGTMVKRHRIIHPNRTMVKSHRIIHSKKPFSVVVLKKYKSILCMDVGSRQQSY